MIISIIKTNILYTVLDRRRKILFFVILFTSWLLLHFHISTIDNRVKEKKRNATNAFNKKRNNVNSFSPTSV